MFRWGIITMTLAILAAVLAAPAQAALLYNDPNAMASWQGTRPFYKTDGVFTLDVTVDYAVYAPGNYGGTDPSGGGYYVYAYQVFNTSNSVSVGVSQLSVGLIPGSGATNLGTDTSGSAPGQPGGVSPSSTSLGASGARWFFIADTVDYGEHSVVLLFTSPNIPQWMSGTVTDGGLSNVQDLPSPSIYVPEPTTLVLLAAGGLAALAGWRRRRRL